MIYCGQTASLAALEVLANSAGLALNMVNSTKDLGTNWAASMETAVLSVASAIVDRERNYLINPRHPGFGSITFSPPEPFEFDPRLK